MPTTPPTTPRSQTSDPVTNKSSPNTTPPSSPSSSTPTKVEATYQIVRIKPTSANWVTPEPRDHVQIVFRGANAVFDDNEAAAAEEDGFMIPCAAHLTWGDRSTHLNCLYYPSTAALFTDRGEYADKTVKMANEADGVSSVSITVQDVIFGAGERQDEMVEGGEDVRDDNGNPFLVLHVNRARGASARLYCKKVPNSRNGLANGIIGSLGLDKRRRDGRWGGCWRMKESEDDCT